MTQEEKDLLLKDVCGRLPYEVILVAPNLETIHPTDGYTSAELFIDEGWKPYLRSMSRMTEEEENELMPLFDCLVFDSFDRSYIPDEKLTYRAFDWLNAHHFDYRGLIEKGLAIESPENMYNF